MNGRKTKAIRKKALYLLVEWLKTLVSPDEAKKLKVADAFKLMPPQTHVYSNNRLMLSAFSLKWIVKKIKKLNNSKDIKDINIQDLLNEQV
jgi:hypothetical protein|tara:strand:- start:947 stop:1219 length:273 start_codon:yes stop_codon:yes gene_type:complete